MTEGFRISMRTARQAVAWLWVLLLGSASISLAADKPQFGGSWTFNQDQSDDASKKVHDAQQQASARTQGRAGSGSPDQGYPGGGYPGGGYPGGGYPGGGYPGGGYPGGTYPGGGGRGGIWPGGGGTGRGPMGRGPHSGSQQAAADWEGLAADSKMLRIDQKEEQISITDDSGNTKTLYPDGKKHKEQGSGGKTAITTHWDGQRLVAESKMGHSGKLTETYELSPDGKQLYVISRFDSSQLTAPLTIRRVYDSGIANPQ